ncbi:MAG: thiamine biosynthesis protein ThiF [Clostridioides sp.]|nr:thiamine biosynthesis protein ThiF [Clostridioides sp.]
MENENQVLSQENLEKKLTEIKKSKYILKENDRITFIQKGVVPSKEELKNLLIARHTPNVYSKLSKSTVIIFGLGGLGSNIAISLARVGVCRLILIDYDVVEPSNLNRQQYFVEDIGKKKTQAIKDMIKKINPYVEVEVLDMFVDKESLKQIDKYFEYSDVIIEAFDNPASKAILCNYVLANHKEKYLVACSGMAGYYDSNLIQTKQMKKKFFICGDMEKEAKEGEGLMAPRVAICANHAANITMKILIEK